MNNKSHVVEIPVNFSNLQEKTSKIIDLSRTGKPHFICIANVHMVITAKKHDALRNALLASSANTSDGMPLVWDLRRQGHSNAERVSGPDLMMTLCERAEVEKLPIYFYGGSPEVAEIMNIKLTERFPDLIITGIESPPLLPEQPEVDQTVVDRINASGAKIVFIGLGCPKQELWMHVYSPHIPAVLIGVGAAFDFLAGTVKRAPLWMQKCGLEWLYRLCSEPRRLWKRYLVTNSLFIWYWLKARLGFK